MQPEQVVLFAVLAIPFAGAAITPFVYRVLGEHTAYFAAGIAAICLALLSSQYGNWGTVTVSWISTSSLDISLVLYLDGLSFLIALLASGVGVLVFVYSGAYMHGESGKVKYYTTLLVFMGSMLGIALVVDLVSLFVFWELTSIASFVLIGQYQRTPSSQYAARKSMLITVSGGLFLLVGFLILHFVSGQALGEMTFTLIGTEQSLIGIPGEISNAEEIREALHATGLFVPVLVLIAIGAAAKSAQVPLHIWLPDAMEAPTPVSAFLHSATMVKAGVYLVGRFRPLFVPEGVITAEGWTLLFVVLGLATMTITAILAVGSTDIKELLAYSTASHLGLIIAGFGLAEVVGGETGVFHILNHASFKATLFLVAGIIAHEAGTRTIDDLGGLWRDLPVTAAITVVAALSMAGVPPFNGFYSKELLFEATWITAEQLGGIAWLLPVVAVFGSVFTFLYSIRFAMLFFGDRSEKLDEIHRPPLAMLAPTGLLALFVIGISLWPQIAVDLLVGDALASTVPGEVHHFEVGLSVPPEISPPLVMSAITIFTGVIAYQFYDRIHRGIRRVRSVPFVTVNYYYNSTVEGLRNWSDIVPRYVQTRILRTYAAVVLLSVSALTLGGYAVGGIGLSPPVPDLAAPIVVILVVAVVGGFAVNAAPSHVAGVLTLSIVGFMVAVFYVLASAPDLALTQLVIETLVLDKLPEFYGEIKRSRAVVDALIAGVVGITVTLTVLLTTRAEPNNIIAEFFVRRAPVPPKHGQIIFDYGGGGNIVNVILVDFRAFDTMGEISVIAMAALAVLTLIGMRDRGENA